MYVNLLCLFTFILIFLAGLYFVIKLAVYAHISLSSALIWTHNATRFFQLAKIQLVIADLFYEVIDIFVLYLFLQNVLLAVVMFAHLLDWLDFWWSLIWMISLSKVFLLFILFSFFGFISWLYANWLDLSWLTLWHDLWLLFIKPLHLLFFNLLKSFLLDALFFIF